MNCIMTLNEGGCKNAEGHMCLRKWWPVILEHSLHVTSSELSLRSSVFLLVNHSA